jgi:hypothetical protein
MKAAIASRQGQEDSIASVLAVATMASLQRAKRDKMSQKDLVYVIDHNDNQMRCGVWTGAIPSTVVNSGATSSVGTADDNCRRTGRASRKVFILPGGQTVAESEVAEYPFKVQEPASEVHITPNITSNSLMSTSKFADADYITIFDKDEVNIYNSNDVKITVTRGAILRGWRCLTTGMWRVTLVPTIRRETVNNVNTQTVLVSRPPTEFLPNRPPPTKAVANV